jgi:hypothetical protein
MSPMFTVCHEERKMSRFGFSAAMAEMNGRAAEERMKWRRFMVGCFNSSHDKHATPQKRR